MELQGEITAALVAVGISLVGVLAYAIQELLKYLRAFVDTKKIEANIKINEKNLELLKSHIKSWVLTVQQDRSDADGLVRKLEVINQVRQSASDLIDNLKISDEYLELLIKEQYEELRAVNKGNRFDESLYGKTNDEHDTGTIEITEIETIKKEQSDSSTN